MGDGRDRLGRSGRGDRGDRGPGPGLRAKHDKNIARRAKEREFRQWSKARMATEPARFEALSSQERRAEFRQWKAEEADHAQDHAVPAKIEAQEFEEAGPEPD